MVDRDDKKVMQSHKLESSNQLLIFEKKKSHFEVQNPLLLLTVKDKNVK